MPDFQSILDGALTNQTGISPNASQILTPVPVPPPPVTSAPGNTVEPVDGYRAAARIDSGQKGGPRTQGELDLDTLTPWELEQKYGTEGANQLRSQLGTGMLRYMQDIGTQRKPAEVVTDNLMGVLGLVGSSAISIAGVGVGQVAPSAGANIARTANELNTFTQEHQSSPLQAHRRATEARGADQVLADALTYKSDLASGTSPVVAKLHNFGREILHSVQNAASDSMLLEEGTADNAGALLINYGLTRGLGAVADVIAPTTRAAAAAEDVLAEGAQGVAKLPAASKFLATKSIPMASQGILMGGMAYQQVVGEVMGRSFDDLKQNSQVYRDAYDKAKLTGMSDADAQEEARTHTAGIAGRQAALIAAPLAAATTHISHMSQNLFNVDTIPGSLAEIGKQGIEGGLVNMSQTLAGNIATRNVVDPNTELDAGLGQSAGEGALYGVTAAAGLQAPGLVVKGIKTAVPATLKGMVYLLQDSFGGSDKAVIDAENEKIASPVNPKIVVADTNAMLQAAPVVIQDAKTEVAGWNMPEEVKQFHIQFIDDFHKAAKFDPAAEITNSSLPEFVGKALEGVTNRMDAVDHLADAATSELDPERKIQLVSAMQEVMEPLEEFRYSQEILNDAPTKSDTRKLIESYMELAKNVERMHSVRDATEAAKEIFEHRDPETIQPLTKSEIGTAVEYKKVDDAIANARISPETGNLKAIDAILAHADAGRVFITPDQYKLLTSSRSFLKAQKDLLDAKKVNGVIPDETTRVSSEVLTDPKTDRDTGSLSAVQYFNNIYNAVRSGNMKLAKQELADMGLFTQHMKNKAQAFNTNIESNSPKSVPYLALAPRRIKDANEFGVRHWYTSTNNLKGRDPYVMTMKAKSVQQAHDVFNDHHALTSVYNDLTETFPELGESKIAPLQIHPALAGDSSAKIAQQFETGARKVADFKAQYEAQQEAAKRQQEIFDKKAPADSIVSRNMPEAQKPVPVQEAPVKAAKPEPVEKTTPTPAPEPTPEQAPEQAPQPVAEPVAEPVSEPVSEPVAEPVSKPAPEPINVWYGSGENPQFSNLADRPFTYEGRQYRSVEHAYQSNKSGAFDPKAYAAYENAEPGTKIVGKFGTKTGNNWNIQMMHDLVYESFAQNPEAAKQLIATGDAPFTHNQDPGVWNTEFPKALEAVRSTLASEAASGAAPEFAPTPVEAVDPPAESSTPASTESEPVPALTSELGPNLPGYLDSDSVAAEKVGQTNPESEKHLRPNLVKSVVNRFYSSFGIRGGKSSGEAPTRVLQSVSPVADIRHATTSAATLREFAAKTGSKLTHDLSSEIAVAYQQFLAGPSSAAHADLWETANQQPANYGENARWMNFGGLVAAIHKNLNTFLERPYSKGNPTLRKVWLQEGLKSDKEQRTINQFPEGKILNITEPHGDSGSFAYNQNLLETAVMAGMDWFLRIGHGTPLVTDDDIKDITGMEVGQLPNDGELLNSLRGTYSILDLKRGITSAIREFWGVKSIATADKAYADGIVEAMAGEVMHGMVNTGFFHLEEPTLGKKQFTRFRPNDPTEPITEDGRPHPLAEQFRELYKYPGALADAVVVDPKQVNHFGTDEKLAVAKYQMHSDTPNAKGQMRAIDAANHIVHQLDLPMLGLYFELGHDLLQDYFGGGSDVRNLPANVADRKSREGMNLTVRSAAQHLEELVSQMHNRAQVTGEHLGDMVIRYEHNMSSVSRLQKLGANNPEASKLTREVIMPTWAPLDLTKNGNTSMKHRRAFDLAVAQGVGIKVESMKPEDARAELQQRLKGPLRPIMEMLETHVLDRMANEILHEAPRGPMQDGSSRFGRDLHKALLSVGKYVDLKPAALHALYEQARLNMTDEADKKSFRTSLYLEADGKTNGIANALGMIANGVFRASWLVNIQKAGFSLGSEVQPLHTLYAKDPVDLYKAAAKAAQGTAAMYQDIFKASGSPHVMTVSNSLVDLMHEFLPGVTRTGGDAATRGLEIERAITKQPSQMTVYGAGEGGVAKNLTGEMLTNMYARMTDALRAVRANKNLSLSQALFPEADEHEQEFSKFVRDLNIVFGSKIEKNFERGRYETSTDGVTHFRFNPKTFDLAKFEATPNNFETLAENMHQVLAKPLVEAIHDTLGHDVMAASKFLQESGNKHSMVYSEYIRSEVRNAVAHRALNDPTFTPGDFLSEADFDKILEKAAPLAPLALRGEEQNAMLIKSAMYKDLKLEYSRTLDSKWGTPPDVRIPGYAGVSSIAKLIIGQGDASMIQDNLNGPTKGEGTLLVFDGVHMPLDKIDEYSREINRNALDAWMNNPMKSVRDAYITLLENSNMIHDVLNQQHAEAEQYRLEKGVTQKEAWDEKMILAKALLGAIDRDMSIHGFNVDQLHDLLLNNLFGTGKNLNSYTASIDARHDVLREEGLSSDQMASAAVGYHNGMKSTVDMSDPEATAADLTARYFERYKTVEAALPKIPEPKTYAEYLSDRDKETSLSASDLSAEIKNAVDSMINFDTVPAPDLSRTQSTDANLGIDGAEAEHKPTSPNMNTVIPGKAPEPSPEREAFRALTQQVGRADSKSGVRLLSQTAIKNLIRIMKPTDTQKRVLSEIFRSGSAKDFKVVSGTPDEIAKYSDLNNSATYADMQSKYDGKLNGFISFAEKRIYMVNPSAETLTHELIHASTYANVLAHYSGKTLHPEVHKAVERLEELMHSYIKGDILGKDTPPELAQAVDHSLGAIMDELFNSKQPDDAVRNAGGLNEFMAWTLSNAALAKRLGSKDQPTQLALGKFTSLAKYVVNNIKDMFWKGRGQRPPAISDDMLSDIKFHTSILMREPPPSGMKQFAESTLRHFEKDQDQRLADIRDNLTRKVVRSIESMIVKARTKEQKGDAEQLKEEFIRSAALPDEANRLKAFFPMTMNESTTFSVVSAAFQFHHHLDPTFVSRAQELYDHVMKHISASDIPDGALNFDENGPSNAMPAFMALALVNKDFAKSLESIPMIKAAKSTQASKVDRFVENMFNNSMNWISAKLAGDGHSQNVLEAVNALWDRINLEAMDEDMYLKIGADKLGGVSDSLNNLAVNALGHLSDKGMALAKRMDASESSFARHMAGLVHVLSGQLSDKNGDAASESLLKLINVTRDAPVLNMMKKTAVDMIGRTAANAGVYDLIKQIKSTVDQLRQRYLKKIPPLLEGKFTVAPDKELKTHMMYGLAKADMASMLTTHSTKDALKLLADPGARAALIEKRENQIKEVDPQNWDLYQQKMKQLANYLMTGKHGLLTPKNAYGIAKLLGERGDINRKMLDSDVLQHIDQLTTLYALERMNKLNPARQEALSSLVQKEPVGMEFMLDYLKNLRQGEMDKIGNDPLLENNHWKGHIPSVVEMGSDLRVAPDYEAGKMRLMGFTRIRPYLGSGYESDDEPQSYFRAPLRGRMAFAQGSMQNIDHTVSGADAVTGFSMHQVAGRILNPTEVAEITKRLQTESEQRRLKPDFEDTNTEHLIPVYNTNDEIYAYERAMDPEMLALRKPSTDITKMAGVWQGRQVEEVMAREFNRALIDRTHEMYVKDGEPQGGPDSAYINVLDRSQTNRIQKDAVRLFSDDAMNYIEQRYGRGQFMIRKDLVEDVIGSRHASIGDMWTGNSNWSKETRQTVRDTLVGLLGADAFKYLVTGERFVQGVMSDLRHNIAVKMLSIPVMRAVNNVYQLIGRGVPLAAIARGTATKMQEITLYNKSRDREIELEAELKSSAVANDPTRATWLKAELRSIRDSYRRMSIQPLIENGEYATIDGIGESVEDLEPGEGTALLKSGKVMTWLEAKVNELPPQIRTAARYGILSRDTALYAGMERLAEYSDFVAKGIYYDDLVKRKGFTPEEALGRITEEYVNFDRNPGRSRAYTDRMGLTWFLNYKIRIAKVALSMMRNNPFHAIVSAAAPAFPQVGNVFEDNIFSKIMDGDIKYSIGPGMAAHGLTIGPWFNLAR